MTRTPGGDRPPEGTGSSVVWLLAALARELHANNQAWSATAARAHEQEALLATASGDLARLRHRLAALPEGAEEARELVAVSNAAKVRLLRMRGDLDVVWAQLEEKGWVTTHLFSAWAALLRELYTLARDSHAADLLVQIPAKAATMAAQQRATWSILMATQQRVARSEALLQESAARIGRAVI
jgi:hypothetical protein